ncbi:SDR family NAD(P)-dependent oxidoreductase [Xanthobacter autotrophicus]|uniref:SDR family NAD(P)-dependent oxidoreductase n=1 Tax=Xanthobacter autotrophicus TaxID=280 RepID=UPI003726EBDB
MTRPRRSPRGTGRHRDGTALVAGVGAGNGLGAALARRFAREGLHVLVAGRTQARLDAVVRAIREAGGTADACVTDVTREAEVTALFDAADARGDLALVAYNVGANAAVPLLDLPAEDFETLWRQNAFGGFLVGREAVRRMLPRARGTVLFTGATASLRARPPFTGFAAAKAALRALAQGLAREFGPAGLHVAHVIIDGVIAGDYAARQFPTFVAAKGADGLLAADDIADAFWMLHQQKTSAWTQELDLRPFKEPF